MTPEVQEIIEAAKADYKTIGGGDAPETFIVGWLGEEISRLAEEIGLLGEEISRLNAEITELKKVPDFKDFRDIPAMLRRQAD